MTCEHEANRHCLADFRHRFSTGDLEQKRASLFALFDPNAKIRLGYPFQQATGPAELWDRVYHPLLKAFPDIERRDFIRMAGPRWSSGPNGNWVGIGGNFLGHFENPWLNIRPSKTPAFMRYQEYLRMDQGRVVEMEGLWDIPQLMTQAGVWPMAKQPGQDWMCPGPADGSGIVQASHETARSSGSVQLVWDMLHDLKTGTAQTPGRGLRGYWHDQALWHGPTGLGTARGHSDIWNLIFRQFREGLSKNTRHLDEGIFFGDRNLVAFSGWPSGTAIHSGDGFLGLAPTGKTITRRSLDFWRVDDNLVQECWVMIDMLDIYAQLGIDVLARAEQLNR